MPVEVRIAAYGALLLFVHIFIATRYKTAQYGRAWNVGARDEELPAPNVMTGRTARAQANYAETFPIAIVALLGVVIAGKSTPYTEVGGWVWLVSRIVYLPLYMSGVRVVRTVVYTIGMAGLAGVLATLLAG